MKFSLLLILNFFILSSTAQTFVNYKDTLNKFSIDVPVGWKFEKSIDYASIKLIAYRIPSSKTDTSKDNLNINIIKTPAIDLEKTYSRFIKSLRSTDNFEIIDSGNVVIHGRQFKWLIETHRYENDQIQLHNYDFITYQNNNTYILTLVTFSNRFELIKPLFDKIANSFIIN